MALRASIRQVPNWVETPPRSPTLRHWSGVLVERLPWLDKLSMPLQRWLSKVYGQPNQPSYRVKDALNGVWLGHPLHPALVQIPIGAWTASLALDLAWLSKQEGGIARGSDLLMWTGLIGAAGAAVAGMTNWVDTDGPEQRTGMWHALLNGGVTVLNLTSALLRLTKRRRSAIALSSIAYALTLYSTYIGGELAYSTAIGVNHVAWEGGLNTFVPVMEEAALRPGKLTRVDVAGIPAVLYKEGRTIYAIAATCSHLGGPLDEGRCENGIVYCPWHRSGFHLSDGSVANSPAVYAQPTFAVRVRNGIIELCRLEHA
jgi:nitrite reductase/ring-hydroxylating ferredoxin subunit/uncharacterized membrane protein